MSETGRELERSELTADPSQREHALGDVIDPSLASPGFPRITCTNAGLTLWLSGRHDEGRFALTAVADEGGAYGERALQQLDEFANASCAGQRSRTGARATRAKQSWFAAADIPCRR